MLDAPWTHRDSPRKNIRGRLYSYVYSRTSTWCGQGRAPIQKGGYVAAQRTERREKDTYTQRQKEKVILVTPVTLSIPLWRCIRNSGDDPTSSGIPASSPLFSSLHRCTFTYSLSCSILSISLFPLRSTPVFLSSSACSLFSLFFFSLFRSVFLYKALYFPLARSLGELPPPSTTLLLLPPLAPSASFFPFP